MFWRTLKVHRLVCWLCRLRRIRHKAKLVLLLMGVLLLYSGTVFPVFLSTDEVTFTGVTDNTWTLASTNVTVYMTSAYLDQRKHSAEHPAYVRLLAFLPDYSKFQFTGENVFCQFHSHKASICAMNPAKVTILGSTSLGSQTRSYELLINCAISENELKLLQRSPGCVSLHLGEECNKLKHTSNCVDLVHDAQPPSIDTVGDPTFGLCLMIPDFTAVLHHRWEHFVEFLEINKILGVELMHLSVFGPLPSEWWQKLGIDHSDKRIFQFHEHRALFDMCKDCISILTNDCIYRNMFKHDYVLVIDGLEVLFPRATDLFNWKKLMKTLDEIHNSTNIGAYSFQTIELFDESSNATSSYASIGNPVKYKLPRIVTHRLREKNLTASSLSRYLLKTDQVLHVTRTNAIKLLPGYSTVAVPIKFGAVHRFSSHKPKFNKDVFEIDSSMDKFVPRLLQELHRHLYR